MKRTILILLVIICMLSLCFHTSALESNSNTIVLDNMSIIISADSSLTNEQIDQIINYFSAEPVDIQTYGLICNIFGHKNTTEIVTTITHRVNNSVPRCLNEVWELNICSRCENVDGTVINSYYIDCCPED